MSAQVETMSFVGEVPWHGMGERLSQENVFSIEAGIKSSGLDWDANLMDLVTVAKAQSIVNETMSSNQYDIPKVEPNVNHKAVVRNIDGSVLGVVGPRYTPLQNRQAFDWFQPFLDTKECMLHTAGSLYNGRKVWVLAQLCKTNTIIAKNDEVAKFILLSNSHDGTTSVRVGYTPIRVVCANTLAMSYSADETQLIRVRHSANVSKNLEKIRETMNLVNQTFEATAEQYRLLATRQVCKSDIEKYIKTVLKVIDTPEADLSTRTHNTIAELVDMVMSRENQNLPSIRGTWWAAYNGINEYLNYNQGRNVNNRLHSLWFGVGANTNQRALTTALDMSG